MNNLPTKFTVDTPVPAALTSSCCSLVISHHINDTCFHFIYGFQMQRTSLFSNYLSPLLEGYLSLVFKNS